MAAVNRRDLLKSAIAAAMLPQVSRARHGRGGSSGAGVTISDGVVTITDPSAPFGTKATAAPYWYQNFDSLQVGDTSLQAGLQDPSGNGEYPTVTNTMSYSGSNSLYWAYNSADSTTFFPEAGFQWQTAEGAAGEPGIYEACWMYFDLVSGTFQSFNPLKLYFVGSNTGTDLGYYYHGNPSCYTQVSVPSSSSGDLQTSDWGFVYDYTGDVARPAGFGNSGTQQYYLPVGQWNFVEIAWIPSTAGDSNGLAWMAWNGVSIFNPPFQVNTTTTSYPTGVTCASGNQGAANWAITVFNGWGPAEQEGGPVFGLWADEMYVDISVQRVVMTNNATYANSTLFANQLPTSWSGSQIVATLNSPGFSGGQTVYFHVFGAAGTEVGIYQTTL